MAAPTTTARADTDRIPPPDERPSTTTADHPLAFGPGDWWVVLRRVWRARADDELSTRAAAMAFSILFAIPALVVATVSLFGLVADPADAATVVEEASGVIPDPAVTLLEGQLEQLVDGDTGALSVGFVLGLGAALWSISGAVGRARDAVGHVYDDPDDRSFFVTRGIALLGALVVATSLVLVLGLIAGTPWLLDRLDMDGPAAWMVGAARWFAVGSIFVGLLGALYRSGPERRPAQVRWLATGTVVGAVGVVVASMALSLWFGRTDAVGGTYGSLGSVLAVLTWLNVTSLIVLLAAELNAEMEHHTRRDTTVERTRPRGRRGATVADTLPESL